MVSLATTRRANADVFIYQLDSARSYLTLQGNTSGVEWAEQAPGSLKASFQGILAINFSDTNFSFLRGSRVISETSGNWKPGYLSGAEPTNPADFGGQATLGSGRNTSRMDAAVIDFALDLSGEGIAYGGGYFDSSRIIFLTPADINSVLVIGSMGGGYWGQRPLDGYTARDFATNGSMPPVVGEVASLVIPVDIEIPFLQTIAGPTAFHFTGQLVGVRAVFRENPVLLWETSPRNPQKATLLWESTYKLQTTATLASPNWVDTGAKAPFDININGSSGFFRVAR